MGSIDQILGINPNEVTNNMPFLDGLTLGLVIGVLFMTWIIFQNKIELKK